MVLDKFDLQRFSLRKTSKQLSYRMRYKAMSSHDQVYCRKWKKILQYLIVPNYILSTKRQIYRRNSTISSHEIFITRI